MSDNKPLKSQSDNNPDVSDAILHQLKRTRPWVLFLAILGFIFTALMVAATIMQFINSEENASLSSISVNFLFISIHFFIAYFLYKYAASIKKLIYNKKTKQLEYALSSQANFWKFIGVFFAVTTLILIGIAIAGLMEIIPLFFLKSS